MADGYIENRMAERHTPTRSATHKARRSHALSTTLPPRRVLIVAPFSPLSEEIARVLADAGCRVAVTFSSAASGYRFVSTAPDGLPEFEPLIRAWHDIDLLITDATSHTSLDALFKAIDRARQAVTTPNPTDIRTIILSSETAIPTSSQAVYQIITSTTPLISETIKAAAATCLFLAMPVASPISSAVINLNHP